MFILDTNVISELWKTNNGQIDARVAAWAIRSNVADFFLSAITVMEIELGILRVERRGSNQGVKLRAWMTNEVRKEFAARILPIDAAVAMRAASLQVSNTRPDRDALIAASALVHGMTVVTRNVADFAPMGVAIFNPWGP